MKEKTRTPFVKNVPGEFFVEDGVRMTCGMPEAEAPDLIAGTLEGHCYFKKQPTTPEELERAIGAMVVSCCGAVRYAGNDPAAISRIDELNSGGR